MTQFKDELDNIFATIPPSDKFHSKLAKLRQKMEKEFPALRGSHILRGEVPGDILKTYTLNIVAVVYDRYSTGTVKRSTINKGRTLLLAIEEELNIDKNHSVLGAKLSAADLHMYGYLLLLITNYENDHQLTEQYTCIMRMKFIFQLFKQFFPRIDVCSVDELETLFNNDEDYIRLYVLAKLSYADILLNAPQELSSQLGEIADLYQINRVYLMQVLQRFEGTRHLTATQVNNIKLALAELNSKIISGDNLALLQFALNSPDAGVLENNATKIITLYKQQLGPIAVTDPKYKDFSNLYFKAHIVLLNLASANDNLERAIAIRSLLLQRCMCPITAKYLADYTSTIIVALRQNRVEVDKVANILVSLKRFRFTTNIDIQEDVTEKLESSDKKQKSDGSAALTF